MSTTTSSPATASAQPAAAPGRRFTDAPVGATWLGPTLLVRGSIAGAESVAIAGNVEGPIEVEGLVHIQEGGHVTGPVSATDVVIEGELKGPLVARGRVQLSATARVYADVHAARLAIAEGCVFDGRIHIGGSEGQGGLTTFREKRRRQGEPAAAEAPARQDGSAAGPPVSRPPL
jgi:cytoskeletal protein CcmA (bactofilin family)